eukprot:6197202-Pleurochrysis_carterae.AAC.2
MLYSVLLRPVPNSNARLSLFLLLRARYGQLLRFHYVGYTLNKGQDGLQAFDSTYSRDTPYLIKHGNGFTCQGIEEALHSMHPGGRRRIVLPPNLGYTGDKGPMPPAARDRDQLFDNVRDSYENGIRSANTLLDVHAKYDCRDHSLNSSVYGRHMNFPR